jgi:glycine/D-amino acid oxidase-like deaminating enzyme
MTSRGIVPVGLMRADYWMMRCPRPIPKNTPLLTLPGAYIKPAGDVVEIGTYRDEQLVYDHADDPCDLEDNDLVAITNKLDLLKTFIPDIEEFRPMHYTSAKTTYTPDGMPALGIVSKPGKPDMFAVTGCNGYGVTWAGGFGFVVAESVLEGKELPEDIDTKRYESWTRGEVMAGAAEKRRTKFGTWPPPY